MYLERLREHNRLKVQLHNYSPSKVVEWDDYFSFSPAPTSQFLLIVGQQTAQFLIPNLVVSGCPEPSCLHNVKPNEVDDLYLRPPSLSEHFHTYAVQGSSTPKTSRPSERKRHWQSEFNRGFIRRPLPPYSPLLLDVGDRDEEGMEDEDSDDSEDETSDGSDDLGDSWDDEDWSDCESVTTTVTTISLNKMGLHQTVR